MALPPGYTFPSADTLRVATWNVENFVDAHDDPYVDAGRENDPGPAMPRRVARFAEAVRAMNADVVVLQEFESEAFLQQIVRERLDDMGYRFFAGLESPTWFQNVLVMSRVPLGVMDSYADVVTPLDGIRTDEGEPAARSLINHRLWRVDVRARADVRLSLVGAHLKAGRDPYDVGWRVGQIRFLHNQLARLQAVRPDENVLIAGDLNSTADSPELRLLLNDPARPAPDTMRVGADRWTMRFANPLAGPSTFTHPSDDPARQLDYLLVNDALAPALLDGSMRVARPLSPDDMAATSDHLPVVATFTVGRP